MTVTLRQLAQLVQGKFQGDGNLIVADARSLGEAEPGDITFIENEKNAPLLHASKAAAAVVPMTVSANGKSVIQVADPLMAFVAIVRHFHGRPESAPVGIDPRAVVHPSASVGPDPSIHPLAVIGEGTTIGARCRIHSNVVIGRFCRIGDDVTIYPGAVLYDDTVLGDRVVIHANAVLGADGFGYRLHQGRHVKVPQLGRVEIAADVEVGAATTIDRSTFGATRIGEGTKIDNLVMIGHNCQVGKHNLLCSQVGIAGSCTTGDYVVMAGQVGIADHVHIGAGAMLGAKAGVPADIPAGQRVLGCPSTPEREQKRILMSLAKLPELRKDMQKVKKQLGIADDAA
jgi:UDP-3-O-[3-hydroxymyristoyl] glucosamine N-acyltransferase